jgi:hypothetical protein
MVEAELATAELDEPDQQISDVYIASTQVWQSAKNLLAQVNDRALTLEDLSRKGYCLSAPRPECPAAKSRPPTRLATGASQKMRIKTGSNGLERREAFR